MTQAYHTTLEKKKNRMHEAIECDRSKPEKKILRRHKMSQSPKIHSKKEKSETE